MEISIQELFQRVVFEFKYMIMFCWLKPNMFKYFIALNF